MAGAGRRLPQSPPPGEERPNGARREEAVRAAGVTGGPAALAPDDSTRRDACVEKWKKGFSVGKRSGENTILRNTEDHFLDDGIRQSALEMDCHGTVTGHGFISVPMGGGKVFRWQLEKQKKLNKNETSNFPNPLTVKVLTSALKKTLTARFKSPEMSPCWRGTADLTM